ncbi:hypothetical protein BC835DRAFT_1416872 [Cytidiella melzeri]|nr:hypothetical protein BC835DRAFT_1416872 [Cytidiella melzeri]
MQALKQIEEELDLSSSDEEDSSCVVVSDSEDDYPTSFCLDVAEDGTLFLPASPPRSLSRPHVVSPATPRPHVVPPVTPQPTPPQTHHRTSNSRVPRRIITPTATLSSTSSARRNLWVSVGVQTAQLRSHRLAGSKLRGDGQSQPLDATAAQQFERFYIK